MKNQTYRMTMLYDFYGELLTDRQKEFFDLYYNEDLSLAEIAENEGISRQGVLDKKGKALYFSDAFPLCSDIFYRYRVNLIFLKCHFLNPLLLLQYYAPSLFFIAMPLIIRSTCLSSI